MAASATAVLTVVDSVFGLRSIVEGQIVADEWADLAKQLHFFSDVEREIATLSRFTSDADLVDCSKAKLQAVVPCCLDGAVSYILNGICDRFVPSLSLWAKMSTEFEFQEWVGTKMNQDIPFVIPFVRVALCALRFWSNGS
jgi:hypothetical protein